MANTISNDQVLLTIPMRPGMELVAAQVVSGIAESMRFSEEEIEEIQIGLIESCINAFERSQSPDRQITILYIMAIDGLEFKILTKEAIQRGKYNFQ